MSLKNYSHHSLLYLSILSFSVTPNELSIFLLDFSLSLYSINELFFTAMFKFYFFHLNEVHFVGELLDKIIQ